MSKSITSRGRILWLVALCCALPYGYGCNSDSGNRTRDEQADSFKVVIQLPSEPKSLHPFNGRLGTRALIMYYTAHTLTRFDPATREIAPMIARELPEVSEDGLRYTYTIHPEAAWEDGRSITYDDVAFSLKAAASPLLAVQAGRSYFTKIRDLIPDPDDPKRFTALMREKYIGNLYIFNDIPLIDRRFFDADGRLDNISVASVLATESSVAEDPNMVAWADEINNPKYNRDVAYLKGTIGPYEVVRWNSKQVIELQRRANYWGESLNHHFHAQNPAAIQFRIIPEESAIGLQIQQEEIDVAISVPSQVFDNLLDNEAVQNKYEFTYRPRDGYAYVGFNMLPEEVNKPPIFSDKNVRLAFRHIIPTEALIEEFYEGRATQITSPVSPLSKEYNENLEPVAFNLERARTLLENAGWVDSDGDQIREKTIRGSKQPLSFELTYPGGRQSTEEIARRITDEARKVGMDVKLNPTDIVLLQQILPDRAFDAIMIGSSYTLAPYDFRQLWSTSSLVTRNNFTGFGNAYTDSLIEAVRGELNPTRRKRMMDEIQQILHDEAPVAFLFISPNNIVIHKRFADADVYGARPYVLANTLELSPVETETAAE